MRVRVGGYVSFVVHILNRYCKKRYFSARFMEGVEVKGDGDVRQLTTRLLKAGCLGTCFSTFTSDLCLHHGRRHHPHPRPWLKAAFTSHLLDPRPRLW